MKVKPNYFVFFLHIEAQQVYLQKTQTTQQKTNRAPKSTEVDLFLFSIEKLFLTHGWQIFS